MDAGAPGDWDLLVRAIGSLGRTLEDVEAVLLTHAHSDHTGFAERARTEAHAVVWIHAADAESARTGKVMKNEGGVGRYLLRPQAYRTLFGLTRRKGMKIVPIHEVSAFGDGETLELPGSPRVVHAPGHTEGSCAILVESRRALVTGDVLVTRNPLTGRRGPQIAPDGLNRDSAQALRSLDASRRSPPACCCRDTAIRGRAEPPRPSEPRRPPVAPEARGMPATNRVTPFGEIVAIEQRGLLRYWATGAACTAAAPIVRAWQVRRWIACVLQGMGGAEVAAGPVDAAVLLGRGGGARGRAPPVRPVPARGLQRLARRLGVGLRRAAEGRPDGPAPARRAARRPRAAPPRGRLAHAPGRGLRRGRRRAGARARGSPRPVVAGRLRRPARPSRAAAAPSC